MTPTQKQIEEIIDKHVTNLQEELVATHGDESLRQATLYMGHFFMEMLFSDLPDIVAVQIINGIFIDHITNAVQQLQPESK
jgi:hypothetical protein